MKCDMCVLPAVYGDSEKGMVRCSVHKPWVPPPRQRIPVRPYRPSGTRKVVAPKPPPTPCPVIKCSVEGCRANAMVGYMDTKTALCRAHRLVPMGHIPCTHPACLSLPVYGFDAATRCRDHRESGMKNCAQILCHACDSTAIYAHSRTAKPSACLRHRLPEMVRTRIVRKIEPRRYVCSVSDLEFVQSILRDLYK